MKKVLNYSIVIILSSLLYQCTFQKQTETSTNEVELEEQKNVEIRLEHEKAFEDAQILRASITDTTFLQTKRLMSDDAIAPHDYNTGLIEDRGYNRTVYIIAFDRVQKFLKVENNQLVNTLKSGSEVYIAEDLFHYILGVIDSWNEWIKEGRYMIIKTEKGHYDIAPIKGCNGWYHLDDTGTETIGDPFITVRDFETIKLDTLSTSDRKTYVIIGKVKANKKEEYANSTEKAIGKRIGFLYKGDILTSPQVNMRIDGGRFQITIPEKYSEKQMIEIYDDLKSEMNQ